LTKSSNFELNYPTITVAFEGRVRAIEGRIAKWPNSAVEVEQRLGVRVVPFIQFPYKLFYRINVDVIEILHIRHATRREPWETEDR
jgi:toxin ParE1/3/4